MKRIIEACSTSQKLLYELAVTTSKYQTADIEVRFQTEFAHLNVTPGS